MVDKCQYAIVDHAIKYKVLFNILLLVVYYICDVIFSKFVSFFTDRAVGMENVFDAFVLPQTRRTTNLNPVISERSTRVTWSC